ncbi:MAG: C25 family cysteine peptidase [Methanobacteriota archaeon]
MFGGRGVGATTVCRILSAVLCVAMVIGSLPTVGGSPEPSDEMGRGVIEITSSFGAPRLSTDGSFTHVSLDGLDAIAETGKPALPFKTVKVLLPFGHDVERVQVETLGSEELPGTHTVYPGQQQHPLMAVGNPDGIQGLPYQRDGTCGPWKQPTARQDGTGLAERLEREDYSPTMPDPSVYCSAAPYPAERFSVVGVQMLRGYSILILNLFPVSYEPLSGRLTYSPEIEVTIETSPSEEVAEACVSMLRSLASDADAVASQVENREEMASYDGAVNLFQPETEPTSIVNPADSYKYVIITSDALAVGGGEYDFQDLVASKISKGISATIVTVRDIVDDPDYDDVDTQTEVRNFILDAYQNWETEYVLLGGDGDRSDVGGESGDNIVPSRGLRASAYGETDYDIASDVYYSCLDGTFNDDGDAYYGEPNDGEGGGDVDLLAEVYVGRAPVDSADEVSNFVMKTLAYETTTDEYLERTLMVGELLWETVPPTFGCNCKDEIYYGCWANAPIPDEYTVETLYDRDLYPDEWAPEELISQINDGVHIINHDGHSDVDYCMRLYNDDVDYSLTNDQYFFGYSQGCYDGSFDNRVTGPWTTSYDCIAEHLVAGEHGAFAFIGNTRYGWGEFGGTNGSSQFYDRKFFDAIFGQDIRQLGPANQYSKEVNIGLIDTDAMRWCYYETTLFGDPEVSIKHAYQPEHDMAVASLDVGRYQEPSANISVGATLHNLGLNNETAVEVWFFVDGSWLDTVYVDMAAGAWEEITFPWTTPGAVGLYNLRVEVAPVAGENVTSDNWGEAEVVVGPDVEVVALDAPTSAESFASVTVSALVNNPGIVDLADIQVDFEVSGTVRNSTIITSLAVGFSTAVSFVWTPMKTGPYTVAIEATLATVEPDIENNRQEQAVAVRQAFYSEDVETGANDWTADGLWHISGDRWASPDHAWCYNDGIDYDTGEANFGSLTSPVIDTSWCFNANVAFNGWYETEDTGSAYDQRWLQISVNGGAFFGVVQFCGDAMCAWNEYEVDVTPYMGDTIQLRFYFDTLDISLNEYEGWYVDDIQIRSEVLEHDLSVVSMTAPVSMQPFETATIECGVMNCGLNNETDIAVGFYVDGSWTDGTVITALDVGEAETVGFDWTPAAEGNYMLEIAAQPVINETHIENNNQVRQVSVCYQPNIWVNPLGYNFTVASGETGSDGLTIGNAGQAPLDWSISSKDILFGDDFEDGDYDGWTDDGGEYQREVTSDTAAAASHCSLTLIGGDMRHFDGLHAVLPYIQPTNISFHVRTSSSTSADGYFVLGDNSTKSNLGMVFFYIYDGNLRLYVSGTEEYLSPIAANVWYHVEFRDIDWNAKNYDYYVDDNLVATDVNFRAAATNHLTRLYLYNFYNSQAWWDEIEIGNGAVGNSNLPEWLTISEGNGTVMPVDQTDLTVTVNATTMDPGAYFANITIMSNDPDEPETIILAHLTVTPPPHDIAIQGIEALRYARLGAQVSINVTVVNLGASGESNFWVHLSDGATVIGSSCVPFLASGASTVLTFFWSSGGEGDHAILANAPPVPGETKAGNNDAEALVTIVDPTPILLVDDDAGLSTQEWYIQALEDNGCDYDIWNTTAGGPVDTSYLAMYGVAIWFTGNDFGTSFTASERDTVSAYLSGGGRMYVSSSGAGYDAALNGWLAWYQTWFNAAFVDIAFGAWILPGVAADPIGDGLSLATQTEDYCTDLRGMRTTNVISGVGTESFYFDDTGYPAMIKADTGTYKIVYSSFDFADVGGGSTRAVLMYRILNWLGIGDNGPPKHSNEHPAIDEVTADARPVIWVHVTDDVEVDLSTVRLYVKGYSVFYNIAPIPGGYNISYTHGSDYTEGATMVRIVARDTSDNPMDFSWTFTVDKSPPVAWGVNPSPGGITMSTTPTIILNVTDIGGVAKATMRLYVQDFAVWYDWSAISNGYAVWYTHGMGFAPGEVVKCQISAEDSFGHWLNFYWNFTVMAVTVCAIPVHAGWNLVSVPIVVQDTALPNALQDSDGNVVWTRAMWYDPTDAMDHWKQYNSAWPDAMNDLKNLDNKKGVWLYVIDAGDGFLEVQGDEPSSTAISIKAGWNLIGYPALNDATFTVGALKSICPAIAIIEGYDEMTEYSTVALPDSRILKRGEAYWVYATGDSSFTVDW